MNNNVIKKIILIIIFTFGNTSIFGQYADRYFEEGERAYEEERYSDALKAFKMGADLGDKYCCGKLAGMYLFGIGVPVDYVAARKWGQKGYELGNSFSAGIMGYSYLMEFGIESEEMLEKALPYFVFSYNAVEVDEENAGIYGNIGILIASTYMTKGEITESIEWIERIMTDYPDYIPVIGWASYLYLGLEEYDKAVELATKADMEGNLQGTFVLGYCMAYGKGILKNELGGFKKIRKAALTYAIDGAAYTLAECYYNGVGTEIDKQKAKEWYQKAAEAGDKNAREQLELLF